MQSRQILFLSVGLYVIIKRAESEVFILIVLRLFSILLNYQLPANVCM
jgi:hypothetical protein